MPKKAGIAIVIAGAVLILSALLLFFHNRREAQTAGREAESLMSALESRLSEAETEETTAARSTQTEAISDGETETAEETTQAEMPVVSIDGYEYVGYLEIPTLELKLPVLSEWDSALLQKAPCRQHGSTVTDDLVIAGHNYSTHFGRLKELTVGDAVLFTDADGVAHLYSVGKIETVDPYDVERVLNSEYDLVLYTCTVGGRNRVAVFCDRTEQAHPET